MGVLCKPQVRHALEKLRRRFADDSTFPDESFPNNDDFDSIERVHHFLKALNDATKFLEGPTATIERVIPTMEYLLEHFEEGKVSYHIILRTCHIILRTCHSPNISFPEHVISRTYHFPNISFPEDI